MHEHFRLTQHFYHFCDKHIRNIIIPYLATSCHTIGVLVFMILVNIPVEQAKDAVCFLQRCGLSLVSSAIIYNIVSEKVTR